MMNSFITIHIMCTYWHIVRIDVVRALFVIYGLKFEARVIIWENIGETILGAVAGQICSRTWLLSANVL